MQQEEIPVCGWSSSDSNPHNNKLIKIQNKVGKDKIYSYVCDNHFINILDHADVFEIADVTCIHDWRFQENTHNKYFQLITIYYCSNCLTTTNKNRQNY